MRWRNVLPLAATMFGLGALAATLLPPRVALMLMSAVLMLTLIREINS